MCIFGLFWVIFWPFFGAIFFGQKCISAVFITFCISGFDLSTYLRNLSGDFACEGSDFGPAGS